MLRKLFYRQTKVNQLIRLVLVFAMIFSSMHIALHDLDESNGNIDGHNECQTCRLNHIPVADLAMVSLPEPLQLLLYILPVVKSGYHLSPLFRTQRARAPPILS